MTQERPTPDQPTDAPAETSTAPATTPAELAAVRELALQANPDAVPELVAGATIAEIVASLEPARAAYRRIAEAATATAPAQTQTRTVAVPVVPAGDAPRVVVDPDTLPPAEKIRRGLAARDRRPPS